MTNYCPYCHSEYYPTKVWPNDPINTPFTKYNRWRGFTFIRDDHITTIQEKRKLQEAEAGIPENERTVFTPVGYNIRKTHIKELRESTEKILTKIGITKNTYFNYYEDGNFANTNQLDWTDVNLNNYTGHIRAKHIEDLRHPLVIELAWLETFNSSDTDTYTLGSATIPITADKGDWHASRYKFGLGEGYLTINEIDAENKEAIITAEPEPRAGNSTIITYLYTPLGNLNIAMDENTNMSFEGYSDIVGFTQIYPTLQDIHYAELIIEFGTTTITGFLTYRFNSNDGAGLSDFYFDDISEFGTRNLWNDYASAIGGIPDPIYKFNFKVYGKLLAGSEESHITIGVDNIKIT